MPPARGHEHRAIGAADDSVGHASAETSPSRAEHDQTRAAKAGELDDAPRGIPCELLRGGGHARSFGDGKGFI
jgi:hypothetical protein